MLRNIESVAAPCGYSVTPEGHQEALEAETCECPDLIVVDGTCSCRECGTVYGVVYGFNRWYTRRRWRQWR